ncbi:MAG: glycosyltransferase [Steroidobacteraceae bacterium]|nr:glycosyltransferase [Steroidobacteraceae bacterium]
MLVIDGLGIGGAEMVVRDLARHLNRDWFDVCVCCTKGLGGPVGEELLRCGIDVFVLPGRKQGRADYLTPWKLRRTVAARGIDIAHSHGSAALFAVAPCRLTRPTLKTVHTFHFGNYPYDMRRTHLLEFLCSRAVDRLVAVGHQQQREIQAAYRLPDTRIVTVWNGIRVATPRVDPSFRAALGTGNRLLIGTIAKLIQQKGLDALLIVAKRCRDAGYPFQFAIVGDGPLRSELEQRRLELGLGDTVVITGWIPDAASRVLPAFDVFFQSSRWEAMSIAILEAMALGKPIVATRVGDNPRVLEQGTSGTLVDSGDIEAMVAALARFMDPDMRESYGRAAFERFSGHFTVERMVQSYERIYLELAGRTEPMHRSQ